MTDDGPCDLKKPYIARPSNSRKFHVFKPDGRALCMKILLLFPDPMECVPWTGKETKTTDDCAGCFRKAVTIEAMPKPCLSLGCDGYVGHPGKCPFIDEAGRPKTEWDKMTTEQRHAHVETLGNEAAKDGAR